MKIVDRSTFLTYPAGTFYQKWEPCILGPIQILAYTRPSEAEWDAGDWVYADLNPQETDVEGSTMSGEGCDIIESGELFRWEHGVTQRDGLFEQEQLFAVWDEEDVARWKNFINNPLA